MTGTSKVVEDIFEEFFLELEKEEEISEEYRESLKTVMSDSTKVTAAKLEKVLYPEDDL